MTDTLKPAELDLEALKPCPFCGGAAELWRAHAENPKRAAWIACMAGCAVLTKEHPTDADAVAAWNRRAPDPRIEALEAERDAAHRLLDTYEQARTEGDGASEEVLTLAGRILNLEVDRRCAEAQRDRMREALEADRVTLAWLNRRGGLGYDAHDAIEKRLTDLAALSQGTAGSSGAGE